jgi:hypothetical protein
VVGAVDAVDSSVEGTAEPLGAADGPVIAGAVVEVVGATVLLVGSVLLSLLQPDITATVAAAAVSPIATR